MFQIKRSPAKITWQLFYNSCQIFLSTRRSDCVEMQSKLKRKYAV